MCVERLLFRSIIWKCPIRKDKITFLFDEEVLIEISTNKPEHVKASWCDPVLKSTLDIKYLLKFLIEKERVLDGFAVYHYIVCVHMTEL